MASYLNRMIRAARLEAALYEEVEADPNSMPQAIGVIVLSSVAAGVGGMRAGVLAAGVLYLILIALLSWFVWAGLTYIIGAKLMPEKQTSTSLWEMLRTVGFASSPGIIRVLGIIPGIAEFVFFVASLWMLVAMVIAIRQALDYTRTWRAVVVAVIGWIAQALIFGLLVYSVIPPGRA